jgi:hypothetical protein
LDDAHATQSRKSEYDTCSSVTATKISAAAIRAQAAMTVLTLGDTDSCAGKLNVGRPPSDRAATLTIAFVRFAVG